MWNFILNFRSYALTWCFWLWRKEKFINVIIRFILRLDLIVASWKETRKWIEITITCWLSAYFLRRSIPERIDIHSLLLRLRVFFFWNVLMLDSRGIEKRWLTISSWYSLFYEFGLFGSDKSRFRNFSAFFVILKFLLNLKKFFHWDISIKVNNFFV